LLVVEKENIFKGIDYHTKHKCAIITGREYPTIVVRATVRKLRDNIMVPVYALVDLDRNGLQIMCEYKYGSKSHAFDNLDLSTNDLIWL
jgi:DNA topoisomerase VI subunit A